MTEPVFPSVADGTRRSQDGGVLVEMGRFPGSPERSGKSMARAGSKIKAR